LKIAGFDITRGATRPKNALPTKPTFRELGATGTQIFAGFVTEQDYNTDLNGVFAYDTYDKMRKGDGQVKAALTVIKLPLVNAEWKVVRASDSALDRMIAEVIEEDLFSNMNVSFNSWLRQMLLHLDYGVMPFEKVWRLGDDGLIRLSKLAPRLPRTVQQWLVDAKGGLAGIRQTAPPSNAPVEIPVDKLLVFINDLEGSDYRGTSILRSAYKHWFIKDKLYLIQGMAIELRATGINVGTLMGTAIDAPGKEALEKALMTLTAHQRNYFLEVEGQTKMRVETGGAGSLLSPQEAIEHHDLRIVRSMIAEFVAMGAGSTGSLAMHRDKTSYLLLALGGIADTICDTVNRHLFQQWVGYNWAGADYPRLRVSRLEQRDVAVYADAIQKLVGAKALTPDISLEEESRDLLSLPEVEGTPVSEMEPEEMEEEDIGEMDTASLRAARRAINAVLRRREETRV
jgi:hypothetical protein